jgi:hypothetical protein
VLLWRDSYPGIYIDNRTDGQNGKALGLSEGLAFLNYTRRALEKIDSKPIGKDLLTLIGKRAKGVGTQLKDGRIIIMYGTGTLSPARVSAKKTVLGSTYFRDDDADAGNAGELLRIKTAGGVTTAAGVRRAGPGTGGKVVFNPFISVGDVYFQPARALLKTVMGVETPAFVALAHELCHALHSMSGTAKEYPFPEEAWTVGAGKYANTRISENAIRREHGIPVRTFYGSPGDCD